MAEILTQDEIDRLMDNINAATPEDVDLSSVQNADGEEVKKCRYNVKKMIERLEWARENESFERQKEARRFLHEAGFELWLARHRMSRQEYRHIMNRKLKERGCPFRFRV